MRRAMNRHGRLLFLLVWLLPTVALSQPAPRPSEEGLPFFMSFYSPQDYQAQPQNWAFAQDQRGVLYVANNNGVLEYDGVSWRLIRTPTNTIVRSLATDDEGTVYVGLQGDFGYLAPDSSGTLQYVSLLDHVAPRDRDFDDVWSIGATSEGVYFQTRRRLFRWDGQAMRVWNAAHVFHNAFVVHGIFYVREVRHGLLRATGGSLQLVPEGERFARPPIYAMMPFDGERVLIGTRRDGFFLYDGTSVEPFPTEADALLEQYDLYHGTRLHGGMFALATLGGGAFLIDERGRLLRILDESAGVSDRDVSAVFADAQGGLWMALNNHGLVRMDVPSELTAFDRSFGLEGTIYSMVRHQDTLHVATGSGLYYLSYQPFMGASRLRATFVQVEGIDHITTSLLSYEDELLAATYRGIYQVKQGRTRRLHDGRFVTLLTSDRFPGFVYAGTKRGLATMQRTSSGWEIRTSVADVGSEILSIAEDDDGTLWLSTRRNEVLRLRFPGGPEAPPAVQRLGDREGLPPGRILAYHADGDVVFASSKGLFRFRKTAARQGTFYPDTTLLSPGAAAQDALLSITEDDAGRIWSVYGDHVEIAAPQADGTYKHFTPPFLRFPKMNMPQIYIEERGVAWISNNETLVRYDPNARVQKPYGVPLQALIRRVTTAGTGALIHGGAFASEDGTLAAMQADTALPELEYQNNALSFEVAAPTFNAPTQTQYQYQLEGADEGWTEWTDAPRKIYTGLREGRYHFLVRARNGQGFVSEAGAFAFVILPPWYRTPLAYAGYLVTLLAVALLTWRYRQVLQENERARAQAAELARERVINERLQQLNEELQQANKLKDEFLATTSHELRTPLTAILGFTSILHEELPERYHEFLHLIDDSGKRLLHTLNALLDLAKLRAGMMPFQRREVNVAHRTKKVIRLLTPLAREKRLTLEMVRPEEPPFALLDGHGFERILYNLVGNAIKFTEEGRVEVEVEGHGGRVYVHVRDTGIGIDEAFLPHLFSEFQQESSGLSRSHQGSGLGLAITARLVELFGGEIHVESKKGKGSTFTVSFPAVARPLEQPEPASPVPTG